MNSVCSVNMLRLLKLIHSLQVDIICELFRNAKDVLLTFSQRITLNWNFELSWNQRSFLSMFVFQTCGFISNNRDFDLQFFKNFDCLKTLDHRFYIKRYQNFQQIRTSLRVVVIYAIHHSNYFELETGIRVFDDAGFRYFRNWKLQWSDQGENQVSVWRRNARKYNIMKFDLEKRQKMDEQEKKRKKEIALEKLNKYQSWMCHRS